MGADILIQKTPKPWGYSVECITILVIYNQLCSFILLGLESISAVPLKVNPRKKSLLASLRFGIHLIES
ncbi:hypothetical protein Y1Q_0008698 [Alligator mississippiensis]|uniref:Uncharacterized protein n=1 Tax=Alligator mississippiensis TaxID=8496 RepID=A0A151N9R0_ALLMI|nr:hypothetical protein Y1Q_0008698 [Alligator mississippiensis]